MKKTPIVFSVDNAMTVAAGVCITSLLENALACTYYDIYVLYSSQRFDEENNNKIGNLESKYSNVTITFIDLNDSFQDCFEIRNVSISAYYRLMIPQLLPQYDMVIYSDIDIVILGDLSHLLDLEMDAFSIAGVKMPVINTYHKKHLKEIGLNKDVYINSGFLLINSKKIRKDNSYEEKIQPLLVKKFTFQDQDILNTAFQGEIKFLKDAYNFNFDTLKYIDELIDPIVVHFTGPKPWNVVRSFDHIWWEYYRRSIFFSLADYMAFQKKEYVDLYSYYKVINMLKKIKIYWIFIFFMKNK